MTGLGRERLSPWYDVDCVFVCVCVCLRVFSRVGASCVGGPICVCAVWAPLRRVKRSSPAAQRVPLLGSPHATQLVPCLLRLQLQYIGRERGSSCARRVRRPPVLRLAAALSVPRTAHGCLLASALLASLCGLHAGEVPAATGAR